MIYYKYNIKHLPLIVGNLRQGIYSCKGLTQEVVTLQESCGSLPRMLALASLYSPPASCACAWRSRIHPLLALVHLTMRWTNDNTDTCTNVTKTPKNWKTTKARYMLEILRAKLHSNNTYRDFLLSMGSSLLIEDTGHNYWGKGKNNTGKNMMGVLHTILRSELFYALIPNHNN